MNKNIGIVICSALMLVSLLGLAYEAGKKAAYRSMLKAKKEVLAMVEAQIHNVADPNPAGDNIVPALEGAFDIGYYYVKPPEMVWAFDENYGMMTPAEACDLWNKRHGDIFIVHGTDLLNEFFSKIKKAYDERDLPIKAADLYSKVSPVLNNGGVFPRGLMYSSWNVSWHKKYLKGDW